MANPFLIIDGYNLLHAAGLARKRFGPGDLERARLRLLAMLVRDLSDAARERATIVFDAHHAPPGADIEQTHEGMRVLFAAAESDADTLIEELVAEHSAPKQVVVVSGDRRLKDAAKRRKGRAMGGEQFLRELRRGEPDRRAAEEAKARMETQLTDNETEQWLEVFGDAVVGDASIDDLVESETGESRSKPSEVDEWQSRVDEMMADWDPDEDDL